MKVISPILPKISCPEKHPLRNRKKKSRSIKFKQIHYTFAFGEKIVKIDPVNPEIYFGSKQSLKNKLTHAIKHAKHTDRRANLPSG